MYLRKTLLSRYIKNYQNSAVKKKKTTPIRKWAKDGYFTVEDYMDDS